MGHAHDDLVIGGELLRELSPEGVVLVVGGTALTDDAAVKAIKDGAKDKEDKVVMKPTEGVSDDEAKAIVAHLRTLKK